MAGRGRPLIDYKVAEQRYVTGDESVRAIARDMGLPSWSSMNAIALREDWKGKRLAYKASIARRSYETAAATVASEQNQIKDEAVQAGRVTLRAYLKKFVNADGTIKLDVEVTAKDALLWAQFLIATTAPVEGLHTEGPELKNVTPPDADLLRRVVEAARERVAPAGSVGPAPLVVASDPRPN